MSYLSKYQKEALISLSGVTSFCEELSTTEWVSDEEDKERLRTAHKLVMLERKKKADAEMRIATLKEAIAALKA